MRKEAGQGRGGKPSKDSAWSLGAPEHEEHDFQLCPAVLGPGSPPGPTPVRAGISWLARSTLWWRKQPPYQQGRSGGKGLGRTPTLILQHSLSDFPLCPFGSEPHSGLDLLCFLAPRHLLCLPNPEFDSAKVWHGQSWDDINEHTQCI